MPQCPRLSVFFRPPQTTRTFTHPDALPPRLTATWLSFWPPEETISSLCYCKASWKSLQRVRRRVRTAICPYLSEMTTWHRYNITDRLMRMLFVVSSFFIRCLWHIFRDVFEFAFLFWFLLCLYRFHLYLRQKQFLSSVNPHCLLVYCETRKFFSSQNIGIRRLSKKHKIICRTKCLYIALSKLHRGQWFKWYQLAH